MIWVLLFSFASGGPSHGFTAQFGSEFHCKEAGFRHADKFMAKGWKEPYWTCVNTGMPLPPPPKEEG